MRFAWGVRLGVIEALSLGLLEHRKGVRSDHVVGRLHAEQGKEKPEAVGKAHEDCDLVGLEGFVAAVFT